MSKFEMLCNEYRENKRLIEELEALNSDLKSDIIALMGGSDEVIEGAAKVSYKSVFTSRFDTKSFKQDHPDIYTNYSKQTSSKRFIVI